MIESIPSYLTNERYILHEHARNRKDGLEISTLSQFTAKIGHAVAFAMAIPGQEPRIERDYADSTLPDSLFDALRAEYELGASAEISWFFPYVA